MIKHSDYKIIVCCLLLLIGGCTDYSRDLGAGYTFVKTNSGNHVITKILSKKYPSIIVHSDVKDYEYDDRYILGVRFQSKDEEAQYDEALQQGSGYFILEKQTGVVKAGLTKDDFNKIVVELGLSDLAGNLDGAIAGSS